MLLAVCTSCAPKTETPDNQGGTQTPAPAPTPDTNSQQQTQEQTPTVPEKTAKNKGVRPTFDIDTLEYLDCKTADLKDKTISLYLGESSMKAGDMTNEQWYVSLEQEYGLKVDYKLCSENTLYSSQLIAQKAGKALDLVALNLNDMVSALSLTRSAKEFVEQNENNPFSQRVFDLTDGRLFTAKANAKTLWYNTNIVKEAPKADWTFEDFSKISAPLMSNQQTGIMEYNGYTEFFSLGKTRMTGYDLKNGYVMKADSEEAQTVISELSEMIEKEPVKNQSFKNGNVAFVYTDTPEINNFKVGFAPLPRFNEDGTNVVSLCGYALGLSKTVKKENVDSALTLALLWSARYTETREDTLQFDLGLDKDSRQSYIELCEKEGAFYAADAEINSVFTGLIPTEKTEEVEQNLKAAKSRAALLSTRF